MFKCHCGEAHDSAVRGPCPQVFTMSTQPQPQTPDEVGCEIRRLLMSLHAPGHTLEDECAGIMNYGTDDLRRQALDRAGICWLEPGEMAPGCCCEWSPEHPEGPRLQLEERFAENKALWADGCILRTFRAVTCSRGTRHCVVRHREGVK